MCLRLYLDSCHANDQHWKNESRGLTKLFRKVCHLYVDYWRIYFYEIYCPEFVWILLSFHGNAI